MEEQVSAQASAPEQKKRTVERSAAYPASTIEQSLSFVADFYKNFRYGLIKRDHIFSIMDGIHNRDLAAACYYTFLSRQKDSYQIADLYKTVSDPVSPKERQRALLEAFFSPNLNQELIEKFDGDELPPELVAHLSRFHRITKEAAPIAANVFIQNAKYCGVLSESNVLNFKKAMEKINNPDFEYVEVITEEKNEQITPPVQPHIEDKPLMEKPKQDPLLLDEMVNEERVKIRLTGKKFAYLVYPENLNKTDITIIKKQIEQLELIADTQ